MIYQFFNYIFMIFHSDIVGTSLDTLLDVMYAYFIFQTNLDCSRCFHILLCTECTYVFFVQFVPTCHFKPPGSKLNPI